MISGTSRPEQGELMSVTQTQADPAVETHTVPPAVQMVQLLAGFQLSQALYATARLGVADRLRGGSRDATALAAEVGADAQALSRVMRTLASIGVFTETADGLFGLTPLGETLTEDSPASMRDLAIMWMETHYEPFGGLLGTVRTGRCAATEFYGKPFFTWLAEHPEQIAQFSRAMANLTDGINSVPSAPATSPVLGASSMSEAPTEPSWRTSSRPHRTPPGSSWTSPTSWPRPSPGWPATAWATA
jgi:hypothetical protein